MIAAAYISFASCLISLGALIIAMRSINIASEKLRLDLYEKRFEIYCHVLRYAIGYHKLHLERFDNLDIEENFIVAFRNSKFLFKKESGIYEIIKDIQQDCSYVKTFYKEKDELKKEAGTKALSLENKLVALEDALQDYLQFDLIKKHSLKWELPQSNFFLGSP